MRYTALPFLFCALSFTSLSAEPPPLPDSSFFIEEAWRADEPVIQHSLSWDEGWSYDWTQEWSSSESSHLFGYTIPVSLDRLNEPELGNLSLDYRWQILDESVGGVALGPRLSVALPLNSSRSADDLDWGVELAVPLTIVRDQASAIHSLMRASWAELSTGGHSTELAFGVSFVRSIGSSTVGVVEAEIAAVSIRSPAEGKTTTHELKISPGFRRSIAPFSRLGITPGIAFPATIDSEDVSVGLVFHAMFEHSFTTGSE